MSEKNKNAISLANWKTLTEKAAIVDILNEYRIYVMI